VRANYALPHLWLEWNNVFKYAFENIGLQIPLLKKHSPMTHIISTDRFLYFFYILRDGLLHASYSVFPGY
jgi:hypothetical protein